MMETLMWMISDLIVTVMCLYPMKNMNPSGTDRKELFLTVGICIVIRPLLNLFLMQEDVRSIAGLSTAAALIGQILHVVLIVLYMYRNQNTGLYCALTCTLIMKMILISCDTVSQYIHVKLFYDRVPVGSTYPDQLIVYTVLFAGSVILISRILAECRKPEDSAFGNTAMMCLVNAFVLDVVRNTFVFQDTRMFVTVGNLSYMRVISDQIMRDMAVLLFVIVLPVMTVLMLKQMIEVFYMKQKEADVLALLDMNREQLSLIRDLQEYSLHEKHEIAQHLDVIAMFMEKGEYESARMYIQKTAGIMNEPVMTYSRNPYLNAVICYKAKSNPDILFHVESMIGDVSGIEPVDLGILLMNLIDSRIDEIRTHDLEKKICMILKHRETAVTLYIQSAISDQFRQKHLLESGIVENIVRKYDGMIEHDIREAGDTVVMLMEETKK
ncbi:MAG: hypothetical protein ACI32N_06355 [Bulleidia sp.]